MKPQEVQRFLRGVADLEVLVAPVAALGKLVAAVTAPGRRVWPLLYPESLHADLRKFTECLCNTLDHGDVTSLSRHGVTPLGQALATLKATPGSTRDHVRAAVRAWRELMFVFEDRWAWLSWESTRLLDTMKEKAITEAMDQQLSLALPSVAAADNTAVVAAAEARKEAVVATGQTEAATKKLEEAQELLEHFLDVCNKATVFPWKVLHQLWYIEATLEGTEEASPDVPKALVAAVAKAELLWEASDHLAKDHLLGTLLEIQKLLESPHGGSGGPGGPRGRAVAEQCQRAIEDIPRLLEDSDVTNVTSSGQ